MTNATKTLALLFAGTLALAFASSWTWTPGASAAFQQELLAVDSSAVQAVRVERPDRTSLRLKRTGNGWSVAPADTSVSYPANDRSVRQLLSTLPSLQVSAVVTRQSDKHPRYGVDSTGTTITMLGEGGEELGQLIVGRMRIRRSQSGGRRRTPMRRRRRGGTPITYVRSPGQPDVYSVEQSLRSITGRSVEDWRDKQIWGLSRRDVQRVDFRYPADSSFTIKRVVPNDTSATQDAWVSAGDTLSQSKVSSMLRTLTAPEADGFAENMSPQNFGKAKYTIRLHLADGTTRTLQLRPGSNDQQYLATAKGYPYVVEFRSRTWDRAVLRGRSAYLKNE
ncbi:MAG: DUF4340 domain-containing protein [Salinibacter sp.]